MKILSIGPREKYNVPRQLVILSNAQLLYVFWIPILFDLQTQTKVYTVWPHLLSIVWGLVHTGQKSIRIFHRIFFMKVVMDISTIKGDFFQMFLMVLFFFNSPDEGQLVYFYWLLYKVSVRGFS